LLIVVFRPAINRQGKDGLLVDLVFALINGGDRADLPRRPFLALSFFTIRINSSHRLKRELGMPADRDIVLSFFFPFGSSFSYGTRLRLVLISAFGRLLIGAPE